MIFISIAIQELLVHFYNIVFECSRLSAAVGERCRQGERVGLASQVEKNNKWGKTPGKDRRR